MSRGICLFVIGLWQCGCGDQSTEGYPPTQPTQAALAAGAFPFTHDGTRLARSGPSACAECHAEEVAQWEGSHHAKANRPLSPELDRAAFTPAREIRESGVTYRMETHDDKFWLQVIEASGASTQYELVGVIGETPIRQYLAYFEDNKFQTISASYDVIHDTWFDVFAGQDRSPGEWGHWTGQGMNWNANCAYCHTTEYTKGYDLGSDRYESRWIQQGIACAECHSGLEAHMAAARSGKDAPAPALDRHRIDENCASCHSRRDQLTADAFAVGDAYHDHFSLSLPDQPGLYHPDGQILDEVFVHASFEMSRMAHAGVSCLDCHNPHNLQNILPVENNMLCMRCHENGHMEAPVIEPTAHSFHPTGSTGNQCVQCHMPKTTYMEVDPRADHGFHSPDPLMTKEFGIPNACNSCHTDQTVDWAVDHAERWYGDKLAASRQRKRAKALHAAYQFQPEAVEQLIALLDGEDIAAWRASYAGLLATFLPDPRAIAALRPLLGDASALVRERATSALAPLSISEGQTLDRLADASRSVRIALARALEAAGQNIPDPGVEEEWNQYIHFNSDRPMSLFVLANRAVHEQRTSEVSGYLDKAIALDRLNPMMYQQSAILLSMAGLEQEARAKLLAGWELDPRNAVFPYSLGLLAAESGDMNRAIGYLEEAVALNPQFGRAWYNLSLAYQRGNQPEAAARAMQKAQQLP
ncbi:MAG: cytochrome c3 family protein [Opitutales bacterium]